MKLTLSAIHNIDVLGELLRDLFFDQRHGVGCYETFILRDEVIQLEPIRVEFDSNFQWKRAYITIEGRMFFGQDSDYIEMWHYWDGDGTLVLILADFVLMNVDCKKDYHWRKLTHGEWQFYKLG